MESHYCHPQVNRKGKVLLGKDRIVADCSCVGYCTHVNGSLLTCCCGTRFYGFAFPDRYDINTSGRMNADVESIELFGQSRARGFWDGNLASDRYDQQLFAHRHDTFKCSECEQVMGRARHMALVETGDDARYCQLCWPYVRLRDYWYDEWCDVWYLDGDDCPNIGEVCDECYDCGAYIYYHEDHYCDDLDEGSSSYLSFMVGYHGHGNRWNPIGTPDDDLYIGLEVETDVRDFDEVESRADEVFGGESTFIAQEDSTIRGFELTTQPFDGRDWLRDPGKYERLMPFKALDRWVKDGIVYGTSSNCGLHVSLSRKAFTTAHLGRFIYLHETMADLFQQVGGRNSDEWGAFGYAKNNVKKKVEGEYYEGRGRYEAVNLQGERVELRYPAGNSTLQGIRLMVEWAIAIFDYTKEVTTADYKSGAFTNPANLVKWVRQNRESYPQVAAKLASLTRKGSKR